MIGDILFFPMRATFGFIGMLVGVLLLIFWIWMIVNVVQRKFRDSVEKIVWVVVVILLGWVGALLYYILIVRLHPQGLARTARRR